MTLPSALVPCPRPACPGCPLRDVPYADQLEAKRQRVEQAFRERFTPLDAPFPAVLPTWPSPRVTGYRSSAKLALGRAARGKGAVVGLYERDSHRVLDLRRCPVHDPLVTAGLRALAGLLDRAPQLLSARVGGQGWLRYAAFQASTADEVLHVTLVTRSAEDPGLLASLAARLREAVPRVSGITWNVNPSPGNEIFGPDWRPLWGNECLYERLGDHRFRASPGSFLQANREQAGWVYRLARDLLAPGPSDDVLDLYSGVGSLALHLASGARRVVGIEGAPQGAADAAWGAEAAGLAHASFETGRVEDVLPRLGAQGFRPTLVTLNPPRKGAAPEVLQEILNLAPRAVLYVSCNPETLARDAAALCRFGAYRLPLVQPVDFFPLTAHVETVAHFEATA
ncbi:MAG: 23S rRNA (uracil(1939)-C(5))-methyltransferase RlmD [Deltaproteobacteria bacterium]|nr:23S rRNA (uracil(1939)-C(5))-methyltransferase RlmD [Deltaproteobacteria bacterium]